MRKELLGVFSGFPDHHFPEGIANRLREELTERESIVFITACPEDYAQNDDDFEGMYGMFVEKGMPFKMHYIIDERTEPSEAKKLVGKASCIFLMGGGACMEQLQLIRGKGCLEAIRDCHAVILGVSAGSMNLAKTTVDFHDSMEPFEGLGFTNLTVSCHHDPADIWRYEQTLRMSEDRVVYAMEDESAFFIKAGRTDVIGNIYRVEHGKLRLLGKEEIRELEQDELCALYHRETLREAEMEKGRIIFLNGVTSSGKTSIVEALQERRDVFFYVVANDLFQEMVGEQYLQEDYWKYLSEVIIMMYHTAKLYSDMGKNVLIDGILVEREEIKPHYQKLMEIMKDNPLDIVEVYCPLEICRQRNIERGDRFESQSEEQAELMSKGIQYSMRVDTSKYSARECAEQIVKSL